MSEQCFACGGVFEAAEVPTHKYMLSSPGCWKAYGDILAREYENPALFGATHRLTVDAYALQHPGDPSDRRAIQSVWVHYAALHLAFERKADLASIPAIMQKLAGGSFPPLPPVPSGYSVTLANVLTEPESNHIPAVTAWAQCAYKTWEGLDRQTRGLLDTL